MGTDLAAAEETAIRALRTSSNDGLARRELEPVINVFRSDARVIASTGELLDGAPSLASFFRRVFADTTYLIAVRTPETIYTSGAVAAEEGRWEMEWGATIVSGKYLARWDRGSDGWRIAGEFYVPLTRRR